jgi:hypothetical protein
MSWICMREVHEMELRESYCAAMDVLDGPMARECWYGPRVVESKSIEMDIASLTDPIGLMLRRRRSHRKLFSMRVEVRPRF